MLPFNVPVLSKPGNSDATEWHATFAAKEADTALNELIAKYQAIDLYQIAAVYAFQGQLDTAFDWLDRAYAQQDPALIGTKVDPLLKSLRRSALRSSLEEAQPAEIDTLAVTTRTCRAVGRHCGCS
jgi:hypothetical protein